MKNILFFGCIVTIGLIVGCNMHKNKSDAIPTGTDSSMMTKPSESINPAGSVMHGDTSAAGKEIKGASPVKDSASNINKAKVDSTKKLKKGKVTVLENTKGSGSMSADKEGFYTNTEVLPGFPGGQKALENFFEKNIIYPDNATENDVEGTVLLNFSVDENGKVYAPKIMSKNMGYGIETEAIRVFSKMPAWTPGKIKGKNVKTKFTLPVKFQLD